MRVVYNNLWDDFSIVASSENANYPASNTQDHRLSRYTRTTAVSNLTWDIDIQTATALDTFIIANHNITASATITLRASVNSDYSTTDLSVTIPHSADTMVKFFTAGASYRYWRLYINDPTNTDLYVKIGRVFIANYLQLTPASNVPFDDARETTSKVFFSQTNQVYGNEGENYIIRNHEFAPISTTMKTSIEAWQDYVDTIYPFFLINRDDDLTIFKPLYCVLNNIISFKYIGNNRFTYQFSAREVF